MLRPLTMLTLPVAAFVLAVFTALTAAEPVVKADPKPKLGPEGILLLGTHFDYPPFYIETDVGDSAKERAAFVEKFKQPLIDTANHFLLAYRMGNTCFSDFAKYYDYKNRGPKDPHESTWFEPLVRVRLWRRYDDFLADHQARYQSQSIPGAFFGINGLKDAYGKDTGAWVREIAAPVDGQSHQEVLRGLYHELGHLFMRTYMLYFVEIPSWIEEGNAQLFQYYAGNGTNPEAERDERTGHVAEMVEEGAAIPWPEFIKVRNAHNLGFTHTDPLRSQIQYAQCWSALEFVIGTPARQQAYAKFLEELKAHGKKWASQPIDDQRRSREHWLYERQNDAFKKTFGADVTQIEAEWKKIWVTKGYETAVKTKPVLRYYRGDWQLLRARLAPDKDALDKALARAELLFQECIQLAEKLPEGYVGMGRVCLQRGQVTDAGTWFDRALALGANNFAATFYGGVARVQQGRAAEAVDPLRRALTTRPSHAQANLYFGRAVGASSTAGTAKSQIEDALQALRRARDIDASMVASASLCEGAILIADRRYAAAAIALIRAREGNPHIGLFIGLAKALDGSIEDAQLVLDALKADATVGQAATHLATVISAGKDLPKIIWSDECWPQIDWNGHGSEAKGPTQPQGKLQKK